LLRHLTFDLQRASNGAHRVDTLADKKTGADCCLAQARPRTIPLLAAFAPARIGMIRSFGQFAGRQRVRDPVCALR